MARRAKRDRDRRLTPEMVDAARQLHALLEQWQDSERALWTLKDRFRGHTPVEALIKTVAVNGLYGTNVYALVRMARHIADVMARRQKWPSPEALVEELARLRSEDREPEHRHTSFASKYAHFFIAEVGEDDFPIYDSLAVRMVRWHLGLAMDPTSREERPYITFCDNLRKLRSENPLPGDNHDLDRYLWLSGQWWNWDPAKKWKGNAELGDLFKAPTPVQSGLLKKMFPYRR